MNLKSVTLCIFLIGLPLIFLQAQVSNFTNDSEIFSPTWSEKYFSLDEDFKKNKNSLWWKYRGFIVGGGGRSISATPGTIVTSFVDDSPSMDSFQTVEEIENQINRFGLHVGFHFGKFQSLSHSVFFDYSFGNNEGAYLGYSIGWNIPIAIGDGFLHLRPSVAGMIGNSRIKLGKLENNASYIQINETEFYDPEINVKLNSSAAIVRPQVDLMMEVADRIYVYGSLGYDLGSQVGEPNLWFESLAGASNSQTAEKPIDTENPLVTFNGAVIQELPFDLNGLRFNVGVGYVWGKN